MEIGLDHHCILLLIIQYLECEEGEFVSVEGRVMGQHKGVCVCVCV